METIVGTIILKDGKILMVKEAKEKCYGKWAFPAGHIEPNEAIYDGAKRETYEETGCTVELKKAFPVFLKNTNDSKIVMMHFLSDLVNEENSYDKDEILETKWISIDEIKNMDEQEFRSSAVVKQIINDIEKQNLFDLNIVKDMPQI
jgi:ADP-ribose pyrophosphatase YjhB (NUDIX family)